MAPESQHDRRRLLYATLMVFVLRAAYILFVMPAHKLEYPDSLGYDKLACQLAQGHGYVSIGEGGTTAGQPATAVPPAYPFFVAAIYKLAGASNFTAVRLAQLVWMVFAVYVFGLAAWRFTGSALAGQLAALWLGLYPLSVKLSSELLTESLAIPSTALCLALAVFYRRDQRSRWLVTLGVMQGLCLLTRPTMLALYPALVLWQILVNRRDWRRLGLALLVFHASLAATLAPWLVRNYIATHKVVLASQGGWVMMHGNSSGYFREIGAPDMAVVPDGKERAVAMQHDGKLNNTELDAAFHRIVNTAIRAQPAKFCAAVVIKLTIYFNPFLTHLLPLPQRLVSTVTALPTLLLFLAWPWLRTRRRDLDGGLYACICLAIAGHALMHAVSFSQVRYRVGFTDPLMAFFAAAVLAALLTGRSAAATEPGAAAASD